jgi:hypothetical protein
VAVALLGSCRPGGLRTITAPELEAHVAFLASDSLRGRLTGSPEIVRAEEYIAEAFRSFGLEPLSGNQDYYVDFTAWRVGYDPRATTVEVTGGTTPIAMAVLGVDYRPFDFSGVGSVDADLVFAGYGITAPEHDWDDYRDLDVRGKVVLLLRYEPNEDDPASPFDGARHTSHAYFATKIRNAQTHGALGMLLFTTPLTNPPEEDLRATQIYRLHPEELEEWDEGDASFLALQISQVYADKITRAGGAAIRDLQAAVDQGTSPAELGPAGLRVSVSVTRGGAPEAMAARNVAGYLRGQRTDEIVVVGAHHDHIGAFSAPSGETGTADTIYNGADDNASGAAGVLELAQAFAALRTPPLRSMLFVTFSGEEQYLLGSAALLESGRLDPASVTFMLNLDMIGRNPGGNLQVYGTASGAGLVELMARVNQAPGLPLAYPREAGSGMDSDHSSFRVRGIPVLFFHTGPHDDYHGLDDEADRIDYAHMERVVELAYRVLEDRVGGTDAID